MKTRILEKASELFLQYGVRSITMDEIARELGMSKKTLYVHFPNKKKLVKATSYFVFDAIIKGILSIQDKNLNPIKELYEIKKFAADNLKDEKSAPYHQLQKHYPEIAAKLLQEQQNLLEDSIRENLSRGIKEGLYRADIPLNFISKIYLLGSMGIRQHEVFPKEEFSHSRLVEMHMEYHIRAIATSKGLQELEKQIKQNQ